MAVIQAVDGETWLQGVCWVLICSMSYHSEENSYLRHVLHMVMGAVQEGK